MHDWVNKIKNVGMVKDMRKSNGSGLIPFQKHALARKFVNFSSLMDFGGSLQALRVEADELKYSSHFIFTAAEALEVAMICGFSKLSSGESELRV